MDLNLGSVALIELWNGAQHGRNSSLAPCGLSDRGNGGCRAPLSKRDIQCGINRWPQIWSRIIEDALCSSLFRRRVIAAARVDPESGNLPACGVVIISGSRAGYPGHDRGGPHFDDLSIGQVFDSAPAMTLSSGLAAAHQAIVGDRLRLALDAELCLGVTGVLGPLVHPALVCDVAIGQSTLATQRVKANLFYRGLTFHRFPIIGDTLYTRTEVVGLRANSVKPGRAPTGMAALRMSTTDQADRLVLDFYRCAMLPVSPDWCPDGRLGDDLSAVGSDAPSPALDPTAQWAGEVFRKRVPGPHFHVGMAGTVLHSTGDVVSNAPELATGVSEQHPQATAAHRLQPRWAGGSAEIPPDARSMSGSR